VTVENKEIFGTVRNVRSPSSNPGRDMFALPFSEHTNSSAYPNKYRKVLNFLSFLLSYSDIFLPTHCMCRGYCCTWSHSVTHTITPHTHTHTHTIGRDVGSANGSDLYLTTQNTHNRQTPISSAGFEPPNPSKRWAADPFFRPCSPRDRQTFTFRITS
jgi:hypothetical protein